MKRSICVIVTFLLIVMLGGSAFAYTFGADSAGVSPEFVPPAGGETESRDFFVGEEYAYTEILPGAVAEDAELPADLFKVEDPNASTTERDYATGISKGTFYLFEGRLYKEVYSSRSAEAEFFTRAEVINGVFESQGLVYGKDYDIIRLYSDCAKQASDPSRDSVLYFTCLYKLVKEISRTAP